MRLPWLLFLVAALLCPGAATVTAQQAEGSVTLTFEPDRVDLPVGERVPVTLHVQAELPCVVGLDGPASPLTIIGQQASASATETGYIYRVDPMPTSVSWQTDGAGRFFIDERLTVTVVSEVPDPTPQINEARFSTEPQQGFGCAPAGYNVPVAPPSPLFVQTHGQPEAPPTASLGTIGAAEWIAVLSALAVVGALVLLALWVRHTRRG